MNKKGSELLRHEVMLLIVFGWTVFINIIAFSEEVEFEVEKLPTLSSPAKSKNQGALIPSTPKNSFSELSYDNSFDEDDSSSLESRSPDAVKSTATTNLNFSTNITKTNTLTPGIEEKIIEGVTSLEGAAARKKITDEAILKVSEEFIKGIIGEGRFKKNKSLIFDKIIKNSSRYIPVVKTNDLNKTNEGQKMTVTLQVNTKVLEGMLQENALLYENEMAPMILPFIVIDDQIKGDSYRWWAPKGMGQASLPSSVHSLGPLYEFIEIQLQSVLFKKGFYVEKPESAQFQNLIPKPMIQSEISQEQMLFLASKWNFPLVLNGALSIKKNNKDEVLMELQISVLQVGTGRILAQLLRQMPLVENIENLNIRKSMGFALQAFDDLAVQMTEAWQRGVLSSTLVKLEVQGSLPLNKYGIFKEALKSSNRSIRQVKERLISSQGVQFELEINGSLNEIASSLKQLTVGQQLYRLKGIDSSNKIILAP